jgi:hypothetical protein
MRTSPRSCRSRWGRCSSKGPDYFLVGLIPSAFACNVYKLTLHGQQELAASDLPSSRTGVQDSQLGPDFDPARAAEAMMTEVSEND